MQNGFRIKTTLPADPKAIYKAWLSGREHAAMTGAGATASQKVGGRFTAWDGYAFGRNLKLKPHWCIVQSWRTTEFADTDPDSRLELCIHPKRNGASELVLIHTDIPRDQIAGYRGGWVDYYFKPMRAYFAARKPAKTSSKKSAKRKSAKTKKANAANPPKQDSTRLTECRSRPFRTFAPVRSAACPVSPSITSTAEPATNPASAATSRRSTRSS
jgi:hypothetical protein